MINKELKERIEAELLKFVPLIDGPEKSLIESMRYSLLNGGKRIRPLLVFEFCKLCKGDVENAIPFACAVEMVHTYSLIHDDLPCMDNDNMRRGKPANHVMFGDDIALLSGDALLTLAFETMLSEISISKVGAETALKAAYTLSKRAGMFGMLGGQVIDIKSKIAQMNYESLKMMDDKKTGQLICAAAEIGCIIAGANKIQIEGAIRYASAIGLAFQIVDDIIDVTSSSEVMGKPSKSDIENEKVTYVSYLGVQKSYELVKQLTNEAIKALDVFDSDTSYLKGLAMKLSKRNS